MTQQHLPQGHLPISTYRLQLHADFNCYQAIEILDYLEQLGVTDLYLSPVLAATPGSKHGYDVVDHTRISEDIGGRKGLEALAQAAHQRSMGVIVDVVPNHMAVPTPVWLNRPMWSILKRGDQSEYANWFDVDPREPILMPVLGKRIGQVLSDQELQLTKEVIESEPERGEQWVLRYFDHVFPVAAGTESLPLAVLVERQHYRLAHWRVADEETNYRRFFDVGSLAAVRVEDPEVFEKTHALLLELYRSGVIDGFRVDHPDGLADPRGYFRQLAKATDNCFIAAEKILEGEEELPADWPISGTTGYDTAWRIGALFVNPGATLEMGALMLELTGDSISTYPQLARSCKELILDTSLAAELTRISRLMAEICLDDVHLRDHTFKALHESLKQLVIAMDRYRAYVVPGESASVEAKKVMAEAAAQAREYISAEAEETLDVVVAMLLGEEVGSAGLAANDERRRELAIRFQQVCGAVQAKGIEDTAFYRWTHLVSLCEVGGDPQAFGLSTDRMHAFAARQLRNWPASMSAGTTHDTKRGEDVRARIHAITHFAQAWSALVTRLRAISAEYRPQNLEGRTENLLWQVIAGTFDDVSMQPISAERLCNYLQKAAREQKIWTFWTAPDEAGEAELFEFVQTLLTDEAVLAQLREWVSETGSWRRATILGMKALQLTLPGVADNYQGSEITQTSLVDPDNRRPVDYNYLREALEQLDKGKNPADLNEEKLALTAKLLRLRREKPRVFVSAESTYQPLAATTGSIFAFGRGTETGIEVCCVSAISPNPAGTVVLPEGNWYDLVSQRHFAGGATEVSELLDQAPVAVLNRVN